MSGFNADARAAEREGGAVVIGGVTYHPVKLTNKRLRQVRNLSRRANRDAREIARETDEYKEALQEAKDRGDVEKEAHNYAMAVASSSDEVDEINQESLAEQLPLLLVDDTMQPLTKERAREHLDDDLDNRDIGDLMTYLLGGADPDDKGTEDPT